MDDDGRQGTIGRARDKLRYLHALRRDARIAGPGSPAESAWLSAVEREIVPLMRLLAEACGLEMPKG